jgi:hypothetical protein
MTSLTPAGEKSAPGFYRICLSRSHFVATYLRPEICKNHFLKEILVVGHTLNYYIINQKPLKTRKKQMKTKRKVTYHWAPSM